jgi:2-polyprenyl-3-methyl-5-hydroxy-6-metoxy-1,4-benzoquinol methylase
MSIKCSFCSSNDIQIIDKDYSKFFTVTSDNQILENFIESLYQCTSCTLVQKKINSTYLTRLNNIYSKYNRETLNNDEIIIYSENNNHDKIISQSRSELLVSSLHQKIKVSKNAKILDFGCGGGALLSEFRKISQNYQLFGIDYEENNKYFKNYIDQEIYYLGNDIDKCHIKFDIVIMSHVLEHLTEPMNFLQSIKKNMNENSILNIRVPNIINNIIDLIVSDHVFHFSVESLQYNLINAGYEIIGFDDYSRKNEISALVKLNSNNLISKNININFQKFETKKLHDLQKKLIQQHDINVIYGTSTFSTWAVQFMNKIINFVDDGRTGYNFHGKKVLRQSELNSYNVVLLPFLNYICKNIISRDTSGAKYISLSDLL